MDAAHIRNFSIIAPIDHGKTTLSDRLLHRTGTITTRDMEEQLLDSMDLEKERGITIKAHPVTMLYLAKNGEEYELNLIDTPGHVDFTYEVSRSLSACEGALLIVDAAQGVEAQTVANLHLAMKQNLTIIPVINKIDLPHADVALTRRQLEDILAIPGETAILASAKEGIGIEEILEAIVERIPAPKPTGAASIQALGFDSYFDTYKGVVTHVRVFNGELNDSAFVFQAETSVALGFGFRCGFLGLLHLEIVQERLRREYGMDIIATYPSVIYRVTLTDMTVKEIDNPAFLPEPTYIAKIEEPMVKAFVICPNEYIGDMMALISEKRGNVDHTETLDSRRVMLTSLLPLN